MTKVEYIVEIEEKGPHCKVTVVGRDGERYDYSHDTFHGLSFQTAFTLMGQVIDETLHTGGIDG